MTMTEGIGLYEKSAKQPLAVEIEEYASLVKRIAQHMMVRMPASVQVDDLIQAGMIGLLEAAKKFDASQGASFETYAGIRIRGSIIDEMRRGDWVPRSVHRNSRKINETIQQLEASLGRDATNAEVADAMGMDINEYHAISHDVVCGRLFSIDESPHDDEPNDIPTSSETAFTPPHEEAQHGALKNAMVEAIKDIPEKEQLVLSLYYNEELNLKEIGQILDVSESRVSQIHTQAALRLRSKLRNWL